VGAHRQEEGILRVGSIMCILILGEQRMTGAHRTSHAPQHRIAVHKVQLVHEREGLFTVGPSLSGEVHILVDVLSGRLRGKAVCRTLNL
jgi:hypothetical protein